MIEILCHVTQHKHNAAEVCLTHVWGLLVTWVLFFFVMRLHDITYWHYVLILHTSFLLFGFRLLWGCCCLLFWWRPICSYSTIRGGRRFPSSLLLWWCVPKENVSCYTTNPIPTNFTNPLASIIEYIKLCTFPYILSFVVMQYFTCSHWCA